MADNNTANFEFDLPRSNLKVLCQEYRNHNWKVFVLNKENNKITTLKRSLEGQQLMAFISLLIAAARSHGIYGKTPSEVIRHLTYQLNQIRRQYV